MNRTELELAWLQNQAEWYSLLLKCHVNVMHQTDNNYNHVFLWKWPQVIKTYGCVSVAKKAMWYTSVLFLQEPLTILTLHISITTGLISIHFTYLWPLYMQPYIPNLKEIAPVVHKICVPKNCPIFSPFPSYSHHFTKVTLRQPNTLFSWINFFQIWHNYKALCGLS